MENVHERLIAAPAAVVGQLLDGLGRPGDRLWPSPAWMPMRLDRPLGPGATGGHGRVRYHVTGHEPGRRVEFTFDERIGVCGTHVFEVEARGAEACVLRHRMAVSLRGSMRPAWAAIVRTCHDTLLEELLDNAERAAAGAVVPPARHPFRARLMTRLSRPIRAVPVPARAGLLHSALPGPDLADAYTARVHPGAATDPQTWADRVFRDPPRAVAALMRLRNTLVTPFGIERGDRSAFATLARTDREVLLGTDASHLNFRASVLAEPDDDGVTVTVSTHATATTRAGRVYLTVVRLFHPAVVRSMLRRAVEADRGGAVSPRTAKA
ncbi:hypothetical protein Acy02nite_77630 [Actinoplanes cyaneus]|uniref:DUF2867 domain-containing protein n=1 Tax=Actinoplanes cyaneus TaxID=52696 RepID=A0A919IRC8_9ACTN|nr:DUF2867 domain-containing protein [Actinoplanes cyaneus]MCW2139727.1 Protein of unknown function (DUF2867) [Actinoplanes cyaneus]GID69882.1 hypothetical protein Acy02nite_77630 [Actinoplanes cyaneus]